MNTLCAALDVLLLCTYPHLTSSHPPHPPSHLTLPQSAVDAQIVSIKGTKEGTIIAQKLVFAVIDVGARILEDV